MKRTLSIICIIALLLTSAALFTGCGEEGDVDFPAAIGEITISKEPERVVVLDDCFADIISYMGYDRKMVARSDECDQELLSFFPSVGSAASPSVDAIIEQGTDLVIAGKELSETVQSELKAKGVTVVTLNRAHDLNSLKELYILLGTVLEGNVTGKRKAEKAYHTLVDKLEQYQAIPTGVVKTSVYLYMNDQGELCSFTKGSFEQQIFDYNGSLNSLSHQEKPQVVSSELRMGSPGTIFYDSEAVLDYLRNDETLMTLSALRNNKVCRIPLKSFSRYGTTCEQIIFDMASFLGDEPSASPDEATPDELSDDDYSDDGYNDDGYSDDGYDDYSDDDYSDDDYSDYEEDYDEYD